MLTDWERNQLDEIERGLVDDFTPRHRARRVIGSIGAWGGIGVVLALSCLVTLCVIGAWAAVTALVVASCVSAMWGRQRRWGRGSGRRREGRRQRGS